MITNNSKKEWQNVCYSIILTMQIYAYEYVYMYVNIYVCIYIKIYVYIYYLSCTFL